MIKEKLLAFVESYRPKKWWHVVIAVAWLIAFVFFYGIMTLLGLALVSNAFYDKPHVCPNDCITDISYTDDTRTITWENGSAISTENYRGGETISYFGCWCNGIGSDENTWLNIFGAAEIFLVITFIAGLVYLLNGGIYLAIKR